MAYQYDVFLSYNNKFPHGTWVRETFFTLFKPYLEDAINVKEARIFMDVNEIDPGDIWQQRIKGALLHSKILVPILSPAYFHSEWCKKEFAVMDHRQKLMGYGTLDNPTGLIVPIKIFDGEHFPEYVMKTQIGDFNRYSRVGMDRTALAVELQDKMIEWVKSVAHAWKNAPDWNDDWKQEHWFENAVSKLDHLESSGSIKAPVL